MNLKQWAENQGIHYHTAYRRFHDGVLWVPAERVGHGGKEHWQAPLSTKHHKVSGHTAAAIVLGRRALGILLGVKHRQVQVWPHLTRGSKRRGNPLVWRASACKAPMGKGPHATGPGHQGARASLIREGKDQDRRTWNRGPLGWRRPFEPVGCH